MWMLPTDNAWKFYGENAPYYGVFGLDKYLGENMTAEARKEFFNSGFACVDELFATIRNKLDSTFNPGSILDFGCGPGRFIIPFAQRAHEVTGIDYNLNRVFHLLQKEHVTGIYSVFTNHHEYYGVTLFFRKPSL